MFKLANVANIYASSEYEKPTPTTPNLLIKTPQYWNPNSARYETMQQIIERGRIERASVFKSLLDWLVRK